MEFHADSNRCSDRRFARRRRATLGDQRRGRRALHRFRQVRLAPFCGPPLRLFCRRAVLPRLQRASRLGIRRPASAYRGTHESCAASVRGYPPSDPVLLPAMAGAGTVLLAGLMARELGGRRFAQGLAALAVLVAPGFLSIDNLMTMNAFEPLFWGGCAYVLIRIIRRGDQKLWLWFGVLAGIGLLNKHSMLIFGFAVLVGLLLTRERRLLQSPWAWSGAAIAFVIFLPNLLWNVQHHFPFLELQANIRSEGRNVQIPPLKFLSEL